MKNTTSKIIECLRIETGTCNCIAYCGTYLDSLNGMDTKDWGSVVNLAAPLSWKGGLDNLAPSSLTLTPKKLTDAVMGLAELLGNDPTSAAQVDARAWAHLLIYAPQQAAPAAQPLSEAKCRKLIMEHFGRDSMVFIRAIEAAHGIVAKEQKHD